RQVLRIRQVVQLVAKITVAARTKHVKPKRSGRHQPSRAHAQTLPYRPDRDVSRRRGLPTGRRVNVELGAQSAPAAPAGYSPADPPARPGRAVVCAPPASRPPATPAARAPTVRKARNGVGPAATS